MELGRIRSIVQRYHALSEIMSFCFQLEPEAIEGSMKPVTTLLASSSYSLLIGLVISFLVGKTAHSQQAQFLRARVANL